MAGIIKFLCLVLFFTLMIQGSLQCYPGKLSINQERTGEIVENKPEWKVTISNNCPCSQLDVKLFCGGFETVKKVDPQILALNGDLCLVNNDNPIYGNTAISFTYAWDKPFSFSVASSQEACS